MKANHSRRLISVHEAKRTEGCKTQRNVKPWKCDHPCNTKVGVTKVFVTKAAKSEELTTNANHGFEGARIAIFNLFRFACNYEVKAQSVSRVKTR